MWGNRIQRRTKNRREKNLVTKRKEKWKDETFKLWKKRGEWEEKVKNVVVDKKENEKWKM